MMYVQEVVHEVMHEVVRYQARSTLVHHIVAEDFPLRESFPVDTREFPFSSHEMRLLPHWGGLHDMA